MMISIIIPSFNDPRLTDCLASLQRLDFPKNDFEIIVVDNHPTPQLQHLAEQYQATYVHEPIAGSYRARNTGSRAAHGDIIAFTDSDCTVDATWLKVITTSVTDAGIAGVMGLAKGHNDNWVARCEQQMYETNIGRFTGQEKLERIDTRNVAIRRAVFMKLGGFNEQLRYGGDMEFGARAHQAGYTIRYNAAMIVYHHNPTDFPALLQKRVRQNKGNMELIALHNHTFIERYFPHLLSPSASSFKWLHYAVLKLYSAVIFPIAGLIGSILSSRLQYVWYKVNTVVAIRLGEYKALL